VSEIVVDARSIVISPRRLFFQRTLAISARSNEGAIKSTRLRIRRFADGDSTSRANQQRATLADAAMKEIHRFIPHLVDLSELAASALLLAREIDHSVYDCCYLALALRRGSPLVTLDRFFVAGAAKGRYAHSVRHFADWE
jgi:predicted nucleic acid-binding protein